MLQISVGCIQVLVRPKAWYPDHIKFWELQSWGPNAYPNQGQPSDCHTSLPAPHSAPGTSSPQKLNVRSVPTGFMNILPCLPAAGREGPYSPRLPEAHKTEEACTAPSSFLSVTVSVVFLSLFYDIQTMQAWEITTIILDSEPPPGCATSGKFSSLFSSHTSQRVLWWWWWFLQFPATHSSWGLTLSSLPATPRAQLLCSHKVGEFLSQMVIVPFSISSSSNLCKYQMSLNFIKSSRRHVSVF